MAKARTARSVGSGVAAPERRREFETIQRKAKLLSAKLGPEHFDKDGNAAGAWADVLAELDAWAKTYKVKFRTTERISGGEAGGGAGEPTPRSSSCPGTTSSTERTDFVGGGHITIKTTCNLRRRTLLGRCVYSCVGEITELALE